MKKKIQAKSIWQKDITPHFVMSLAIFGLVVSSLVSTLGISVLGVEAQVAFAQNESMSQTAAAMLGGEPPPVDQHIGSSTTPVAGSAGMFCPKLDRTIGRGTNDATTTGDVGQLQQFLANHYNLEASTTISGYFGSTTQAYLEKFQQEQGIPPAPTVGPLTRAAIAKFCGGDQTRPATPMIGSTTPALLPPHPPMPPKPAAPSPVSYDTSGASNAASMVEAMSEIGDGYTKLFQSVLASF